MLIAIIACVYFFVNFMITVWLLNHYVGEKIPKGKNGRLCLLIFLSIGGIYLFFVYVLIALIFIILHDELTKLFKAIITAKKEIRKFFKELDSWVQDFISDGKVKESNS